MHRPDGNERKTQPKPDGECSAEEHGIAAAETFEQRGTEERTCRFISRRERRNWSTSLFSVHVYIDTNTVQHVSNKLNLSCLDAS